jgi:hypothetical protein
METFGIWVIRLVLAIVGTWAGLALFLVSIVLLNPLIHFLNDGVGDKNERVRRQRARA